ncbi:hypothetical protein TWF696_001808 [Orbilia brochopaga]|uniref:Uncharacterized protein n=1 Tax=Orbilia brochopaga TaxID=3140254 RepID=A0AAV9U5U4_9PEZI
MSLSSFMNKLEQKVTGHRGSSNTEPVPQNAHHIYAQDQAQPSNTYHMHGNPSGPNAYYGNPQAPNAYYGNPPMNSYYGPPAPSSAYYGPPNPSNTYYGGPPPQPPVQNTSYGYPPAHPTSVPTSSRTRTFNLSSSSSGSSTTAKDAATDQIVYVVRYPSTSSYSNKTGKPKSGMEQELHAGGKDGPLLGGVKRSETTGKVSVQIGDKLQKLKNQSGSKCGFVAPDGRNCEWRPGKEKGAYKLVDVASGQELGSFEPYEDMVSSSKIGTFEVQTAGGEEWVQTAFVTLAALMERKAGETVAKEVIKAIIGI